MAATTVQELVSQLTEFKNSIALYEDIVYNSGTTKKNGQNSKPPKLATPKSSVQAIVDVALLSKAHTTKVGIAFKPPVSVAAASKTLADSSALIPALVGAFVAINDNKEKAEKVGILILEQVKDQVLDFLSAHKGLCVDLISLAEKPTDEVVKSESEDSGRLVSVGRVWKACDDLAEITKLRSSKILALKVEQFAEMVQDALLDLDEFIENGNDDGDDDFILDFGSDEEDDEILEKLQKAGRSKKSEPKVEDDNDDDDDDKDYEDGKDDEDTEPSELQLLAQEFKPYISGLPEFYRNVVIPQANKNASDVMLHQKIYQALSYLSIKIDDIVGEYINDEADEAEVKESHNGIKTEIKALADLVSGAPVKDSDLQTLTNDFVQKLNV